MLPPVVESDIALLDLEFDRIAALVRLAEAARTSETLGDDFAGLLHSLGTGVEAARGAGAWRHLALLAPPATLAALTRLDIDLLALTLAPVARPALGVRMQALQPQACSAWPSLALLEELLLLEGGAQLALLFERLAPTAPLVALDLLRVKGATPSQVVRPSPRVIRAVLNRDAEMEPPPGATLTQRRGDWSELVLPAPTMAALKDFTAWVAATDRLTEEWGAPPQHGPLALFSGPSGTGKTFAAGVIAAALEQRTRFPWALFTLDLGQVMSKYVGETEANLNALLASLEGRRAILLIDEADGLLGKRGEVTDARDRYANLEVSHLLSRIESHQGPVILTTNLRSNVDPAFIRRFQLVVDFPPPDGPSRALLWKTLLPPRSPIVPDLDFAALGEAVRLSGGAIRNAATYAAVLAVDAGCPIDLTHIARAAFAELSKDARQIRLTELGFLADHLQEVQ